MNPTHQSGSASIASTSLRIEHAVFDNSFQLSTQTTSLKHRIRGEQFSRIAKSHEGNAHLRRTISLDGRTGSAGVFYANMFRCDTSYT